MINLLLLYFFILKINCKIEILYLNGNDWIVTQSNISNGFTASVPGGIYTDLMRANAIGDVFFGENDTATRWVGNTNWTYTKTFTVIDNSSLPFSPVSLIFDGVDTFADVILNNVAIGETDNMFVRYIFNVTGILKPGNNTLKVHFKSPTDTGKILNDKQLELYKVPPECPPDEYRGECHINMLRKMQSSFSWDWGPALPSMGFWKSVYLESTNSTIIRDVVSEIRDINDDYWRIDVDIYVLNATNKIKLNNWSIVFYADDDIEIIYSLSTASVYSTDNDEYIISSSVNVEKNFVKLWWPNGYGAQPLYKLLVTNSDQTAKEVFIGFRTIELIQKDLDNGATFYFKINGVPIFAKGSNEIPLNILPELGQNQDLIKSILSSAKDANMNMLRVWGGGVYESDYFYQLADQLGIMIWQDFMFACALYPSQQNYLDNVRGEVRHNIRRIYHHPSVVVYSANNENEEELAFNVFLIKDNMTLYKKDYITLYINTVYDEFQKISKNRSIFLCSSPSNGKSTEKDGWLAKNPGSEYWGDVHYYNYIADPWDSNIYPVPRFCSEYGYQSLPFETTLLTATDNISDLYNFNNFMIHRQHHPVGNVEMLLLIKENLDLPKMNQSTFYVKAFIYFSQIIQSQAIRIETEHYRRYRSYLRDDGKGYTMGALYWQLNDVWVAPTWSSIDFTGRWKMLHYFAKKMFSPIIITGHLNTNRQLQLYTVNDNLNAIENVTIVMKVFKYDSPDFQAIYENHSYIDLNSSASQLIEVIDTDNFLSSHNCGTIADAKRNCFFYFTIEKDFLSNNDAVLIGPENYLFPNKLKSSNLASATITSIKQINSTDYDITVKANNIALFVWLDSQKIKGKFSDNGFLQVDNEKNIRFKSYDDKTTLEDLEKYLIVTHLKDKRWI